MNNDYEQKLEILVSKRIITRKSDKSPACKIKKAPYYFSLKSENK